MSFGSRWRTGLWASVTLVGLMLVGNAPTASAQDQDAKPGAAPMVDVLITFKQTPGPQERQLVRAHGGAVKRSFWLVPTVAARLPENALKGLANARGVTAIEPDGLFHAIDHTVDVGSDTELDYGWGVKHIGSGPLHLAGKTGTGVKVAILDSGIAEHVDLQISGGWNFVNGSSAYADDNGHGTHVAGTVAGLKNGFGVVGVTPDAELYALKVLDQNGSGSFSNIIAALQWCVENGMSVTNNSYGSSRDPGDTVRQAFDAAYSFGIVHVAAAGNSGSPAGKNDTVNWPARYGSVIAVAATHQDDTRASFSSTGPDVELSAPGVDIWSTYEGLWVQLSGTSMASPHVAGVAALVIAEGVTEPDLVRYILSTTAKPLGSANRFGAGLVQAQGAVAAVSGDPVLPEDPAPPVDEEPAPSPGKGNGKKK